jgi:hypothetical protein
MFLLLNLLYHFIVLYHQSNSSQKSHPPRCSGHRIKLQCIFGTNIYILEYNTKIQLNKSKKIIEVIKVEPVSMFKA